jgi:hypothetical protein
MKEVPLEILKHILSYNNCIIRKGEIIQINKIDKNDCRYEILEKIKHIMPMGNFWNVYLKINENKDYHIIKNNDLILIYTLYYNDDEYDDYNYVLNYMNFSLYD